MNRSRLALASLLLLVVGFGGTMSSTSASFTAAASTPANSINTGALEDPQPNADPVTFDSVTLTWNAAPTGGATPTYSVTRSNADGTDPTTIYTGADTTYTDRGDIPAELKSRDIIAVSTGGFHSLALDSDHNVYAWGWNGNGQLGTGDRINRATPTRISFPTGVTITSLAAGGLHSLALGSDHNVYAWGWNGNGLLGTGDRIDRTTPTRIGFPTGAAITSLVAGSSHSLALDSDHNVYAWGDNGNGKLGTGDRNDRMTPTAITFPTGVTITSLAAGTNHSLALTTDHAVYAWGDNSNGQLGTGDRDSRTTPTAITFPTGISITSLAAGRNHSLALDADHNVYAWGWNGYGQLGTGDRTGKPTPTPITFPTGVTIASIGASNDHSLATDTAHNAYAWGNNGNKQLGTGGRIDRTTPTRITFPTGVTITSLAAGSYQSLALTTDHNVYAWGSNAYGQLGTGDRTDRPTPAPVDMTYRACPARSVLRADGTTCSLRSDHSYRYTVTTTLGGWTHTSVPLIVPILAR
ncbi:hypothetical protein [uncultured Microbacterium sp.]|uniref:RCC1 domain-containing protein n=1 Tax=uncultured Microbacterium sp. TaxID=191216 RepID=UPI0025CBF409|nr:hypothetical protein [uncultured Microbacterium sp.]